MTEILFSRQYYPYYIPVWAWVVAVLIIFSFFLSIYYCVRACRRRNQVQTIQMIEQPPTAVIVTQQPVVYPQGYYPEQQYKPTDPYSVPTYPQPVYPQQQVYSYEEPVYVAPPGYSK